MSKNKSKKGVKIILLIIVIIILLVVTMSIIQKLIKNKYKKILTENDSVNYEVIETTNDSEVKTSKQRNGILVVEDGAINMWFDSKNKKSIVLDKSKKTAIINNNDDNAKVPSLNATYINEYFDNSRNKFKLLKNEKEYNVMQFTNKDSGLITILYLNKDSKLVEKVVMKNEIASFKIEYKVKLDCVKKDDVKEPDVKEYMVVEQ